MNKLLKILSWVWVVGFTIFFVITIYKSSGHPLPEDIEHYRSLFGNGLERFLSSWAFGVFFVAMWVGLSFYLSSASGWKRLSNYFSVKRMGFVDPTIFKLGSGKFDGIMFNGMLKVGFSESGVVFKVLFPFRFGYPPLYIPWESIENIEIQKSRAGGDSIFRKIAESLSPFMYTSVKLVEYPEQVILFRWKEDFRKNIPAKKLSKENAF